MCPSTVPTVADGASWRGRKTLPELFRGALADWPNNSYLGVRYKRADGTPGPCYEWESYREVELSVTAIARSLRCTLGSAAGRGLKVAVLGHPSPEAVKILLALCHISAVPVLVTPDVTPQQLRVLLSECDINVVFLHQNNQELLASAAAVPVGGSRSAEAASGSRAAATAAFAAADATEVNLQLVVVWGAGGIRYTHPSADLIAALAHAHCNTGATTEAINPTDNAPAGASSSAAAAVAGGAAKAIGYEDFKRSHFNVLEDPSAAFTGMIMPQPADIAAVMVTPRTAAAAASPPAAGAAGVLTHAAVSLLQDSGLEIRELSHAELVSKAASLLNAKFPGLEQAMAPYEPGVTEEWAGRPHIPTMMCTNMADVEQLVHLAAATAAAGRAGFSEHPEAVVATGVVSDANVLQADL